MKKISLTQGNATSSVSKRMKDEEEEENESTAKSTLPETILRKLQDGYENGFKEDKLFLANMDIDDDMMAEISEWVSKFNGRLKELNSKGASILFNALKECKSTVKKVNFHRNVLDDNCMESLGEYILETDSLESINLGGNKISDKGIGILCDCLIGNTTLTFLELVCNTGITDDSTANLIEVAKESHLTKIPIIGTCISQEKQQEIYEFLKIPVDERAVPVLSSTKSAASLLKAVKAAKGKPSLVATS